MNAIRLHPLGMLIDVNKEKWHEGQMKLPGHVRKHRGERLDVVGSLVGRQSNAE